MIERWRKGFKVVYGVRMSRSGETRFKLFTSKLYYGFIDRISEVLPCARPVTSASSTARWSTCWRGCRSATTCAEWWRVGPAVRGRVRARPARRGETKYTLRRMVRLGLDGVTSFSERPLRLATQLGLIVMVLAFGFAAWTIGASIVDPGGTSRGWPSLMAVVLFLGGVQLLCIGVLGEYLGRVYRDEGASALRRRRHRRRRAPRRAAVTMTRRVSVVVHYNGERHVDRAVRSRSTSRSPTSRSW